MESRTVYKFYYAGPLFTLADLHMNSQLSSKISAKSSGKFVPVLPQNLDTTGAHPQAIRDGDIKALLSCDLAVFTYDGSELDSGTVVEYMIAKFADIPAVLFRSDVRGSGDQSSATGGSDQWNLMSSFWPRTEKVIVPSESTYKKALRDCSNDKEASQTLTDEVAHEIVKAMELVLSSPPRIPKELRHSVYEWAALMPGFVSGSDAENVKLYRDILEDKIGRSLL